MRPQVSLVIVGERHGLQTLVAELIGDMMERLAERNSIGLHERLARSGCSHASLGFRDVGQRIAHPVQAGLLKTLCQSDLLDLMAAQAGLMLGSRVRDQSEFLMAGLPRELVPDDHILA